MKSFLTLVLIVFVIFAVVNNLPPNISFDGRRVVDQTAATFRYAALLSEEPETKISVPIHKIKKNQIADTFGSPRGNDRQHQGQDIFAPRNTPVYSATKGFVWRIGENRLGGNTLSVVGAGGRIYYYAHLEKYADKLQVGDEVSTDTILGYVGTTGNAKRTPPHLHFSVYTASGAVNPLSLFN